MICSEDFLYFVIMTAMFLGFAILKLQFIRERRSVLSKVGRFLGVFIVAMLLGYVTSRPYVTIVSRFDAYQDKHVDRG